MGTQIRVTAVVLAWLLCWPSHSTFAQARTAPPMKAISGIEAPEDVQHLLNQVRRALGGADKLMSVRSLLIQGERVPADGGSTAFAYRLLLPDRFQRTEHDIRFSLDGTTYWQSPDPGQSSKLAAKRNTNMLFFEQCLTLLLRAPPGSTLQAQLAPLAGERAAAVTFTGPDEFNLTLEIDAKTYRPSGFSRSQTLRRGDSVAGKSMRRVTFDEFQRIKGISFPLRMTEAIEGFSAAATLRFNSIRVNEGVAASDFKER